MALRVRMLTLQAVLLLVVPILNLSAQATDPLVGTWILNVEKSKYDPGPPPKSQTRTFDYTRDGMILCTNSSVNAQGNRTFSHWLAKLDGTEGLEFSRSAGAAPTTVVSMKRVDPYTIEILATRNGQVAFTGFFVLSKDGKTLNHKLKGHLGRGTTFDAIYEKQE